MTNNPYEPPAAAPSPSDPPPPSNWRVPLRVLTVAVDLLLVAFLGLAGLGEGKHGHVPSVVCIYALIATLAAGLVGFLSRGTTAASRASLLLLSGWTWLLFGVACFLVGTVVHKP